MHLIRKFKDRVDGQSQVAVAESLDRLLKHAHDERQIGILRRFLEA